MLVTANQQSGSLSVVDAERMVVRSETTVGTQLTDLVVSPRDDGLLLATDEGTGELLAIRRRGEKFSVVKRLLIGPDPVALQISADGSQAYVACLWSRTVGIVDVRTWLAKAEPASVVVTIRLPFSPREMLPIDEAGRLIVADAFGSKMAVVDLAVGRNEQARIESVRDILGHGIRQLRRDPNKPRVVMTHQILSRGARSNLDDVHWGGLMVNCLRSLALDDVTNPTSNLSQRTELEYLGGPGRGAGDPAGFVIRANGSIAIALSGTSEVLLDDGSRSFGIRLEVGERPTKMVLSPDGLRAYVVNTFGDSVNVVHLARRELVGTISLGQRPDPTPIERGERLFHNARLSHDGWFSCASCHLDGHTTGQLNDNFTDGTFDTPKRVLTLRGIAETAPYAWNGRFQTLREQIQHSVRSTMQGKPLSVEQADDLEFYLRTLTPAPPIPEETDLPSKQLVDRGSILFEKLDCARCHSGPAFTSADVAEVKLKDERGASSYNPPSLRGVSQQGPWFHDGRATTLEEVVSKFRHQIDEELSAEQVKELVAFLNRL